MSTLTVPTADLVRYRRHFHAHPELSLEEHETAKFILHELADCGFDDIRSGVAKTGILLTLKGGKPGPTTLLRADMDALPMQEVGQHVYASRTPGVMHACGHDGHMAMLLCAARDLAKRRSEIPGTLVFCFQPGEEGFAGAKLMIEEGALENPYVDRVFAQHLYTGLDVGKVGVRDGPFFASSDRFEITITGRGGHGAMPHQGADPIVAAAHIVTMLQTIVSREIAPKDPVVVTVGKLSSGTTFNVIPDEAVMQGTVRAFDDDVRNSIPERMERMLGGLCDALRVDFALDYAFGYPPTLNDAATTDVVREVAREVIGVENVVDPHEIGLWAEDMSYMQNERPGSYFVVGARGTERGTMPQHSARYDIDERALEVGYNMWIALGLRG
jgi:amidohydrolase